MSLPISPKHPLLLLLIPLLSITFTACTSQKTFSSPDTAVDALVSSLRTDNHTETRKILGPAGDDLLFSGDPVQVQYSIQRFLASYDANHTLVNAANGTMLLAVGNDNWPLPIPLAQNKNEAWYFDTAAGKEEILNRRIGRNELDTLQTCLAIVDAQREYAESDPAHLGVPAYAEHFISDPDRKNGLYWQTAEGEKPSPLGSLVATAEAQGYPAPGSHAKPSPYCGYFFKILTAQGPSADGGARDYLVDGKLLGGFAVIAWPATWGNTGIMTFIVNQDGTVYQRNLGEETAKLAPQITTFDPDANWSKAEVPPATQPAQ